MAGASSSSAGIRWSRQETRMLLSILGEAKYIQRLQTVHHNADVYQAVSRRMQQEGFRRTERQCRSKFKVLKALYLKAAVAQGTGIGEQPRCPFYNTLDRLLRNQIAVDADTDLDPDNMAEEGTQAQPCKPDVVASGEGEPCLLSSKGLQEPDPQAVPKMAKESTADCHLSVSEQIRETSGLEDSWDEFSGAGCSQGTPSYNSSHTLFRGSTDPCQNSSPLTRLGLSQEPSPHTSLHQSSPGVSTARRPPSTTPAASTVPFVPGTPRPLTRVPPPPWARRRRRSVARTLTAELEENRRLARELSKQEAEKLDRLIALGQEISAQQDAANILRRDAVSAIRHLATAVEQATRTFQLGLEKLLPALVSNAKS